LGKAVIESFETKSIAIACKYDNSVVSDKAVRHPIKTVTIAIQMVMPTAAFLVLWLQLDEDNSTERAGQPFPTSTVSPEPYLQYQQYNAITGAGNETARRWVSTDAGPCG
jgi:hypothetical protein